MALPEDFRWLEEAAADGHPKMIAEGLKLYGTYEWAEGDNPLILSWATEVGLQDVYKHDDIPWCGLFMALVAHRAGWIAPAEPLRAAHWNSFGFFVPKDDAVLGDVLVFTRKGGGHVGLYVGQNKTSYFVLGGNQRDQVNIMALGYTRLVATRRPPYHKMPRQCVKHLMDVHRDLSTNEA